MIAMVEEKEIKLYLPIFIDFESAVRDSIYRAQLNKIERKKSNSYSIE